MLKVKAGTCAHVSQGLQVCSSADRVSKWPTTTRPLRERVIVTFNRLGSPRKPTLPLVLALTVETMIRSSECHCPLALTHHSTFRVSTKSYELEEGRRGALQTL